MRYPQLFSETVNESICLNSTEIEKEKEREREREREREVGTDGGTEGKNTKH